LRTREALLSHALAWMQRGIPANHPLVEVRCAVIRAFDTSAQNADSEDLEE
tara:strand:+ start:546 stop:698 length:153 start_codon:yes stop_codon:yes gene_type:complete